MGGDVVLDDRAQHGEPTVLDHGHLRCSASGRCWHSRNPSAKSTTAARPATRRAPHARRRRLDGAPPPRLGGPDADAGTPETREGRDGDGPLRARRALRRPARRRAGARSPRSRPSTGLVVECADSGWCGAVVGTDKGADGWAVVLEDRHGVRRPFALRPAAFLLDGEVVTLVRPAVAAPTGPRPHRVRARSPSPTSAPSSPGARGSGSRACTTPSSSRRSGATTCGSRASSSSRCTAPTTCSRSSATSPPARAGASACCSTTWCPGSKETRIADEVRRAYGRHVTVLGHPYVDVWQAIRPQVLGIEAWPVVPKGRPWKEGVLAALGRPHATPADVAAGLALAARPRAHATPTSSRACWPASRSSSTS